jgi:bifunctional non-homologous end joining protein LigD
MTDAATIAGVRFTHPDKEVFPAQHITKRAVAEYLQAVAPRMLPHVKRRLISLVRCPDGQGEPCFFQRHLMRGFPASVHRLADAKKGAAEAYIFIDDLQGLLGLAQMGVLELHIWGSHVETIETPDRMVFDLDPAEDVPFSAVKEAAVQVRRVLDALGLESFAMLSGGKGVHVVVPLLPKREWEEVKAFAGAIAVRMAADQPDRFVATMTKAKRHGKVFIDFFRNDKTATAVSPYSTRAKAGAPLAWPVSWPGLARAKAANEVTIATWRQRLRGRDPWDGYHRLRQSPSAAAFRALGLKA